MPEHSIEPTYPLIDIPKEIDDNEYRRSIQALSSLNLTAIYASDPRPTLIVDTTVGRQVKRLVTVYANPALNKREDLLSCLSDALHGNTEFGSWALSSSNHQHYIRYGGALWYAFELQERWKVICTILPFSGMEEETGVLPTSPTLQALNSSGNEHISHESTITGLEKQIRIHEGRLKQAAKQQQACREAIQRLRRKLRALEPGTPESNSTRASSSVSMFTLPNQDVEIEASNQTHQNYNVGAQPKDAIQSVVSDVRDELLSKASRSRVVMPMKVTGHSDTSLALQKFQRLAEAVDVGFFDFDPSGRLLHANEAWYALSGHPREPELHTVLSFQQCVYPDDAEMIMQQWSKLLRGEPVTFEMRWKKKSLLLTDPEAIPNAQWVLAACVPVIAEDGTVKSISGCTTDIEAQKLSEKVALQRAEAVERARASEERFARFAEVAPIAIFRFDKHKKIEYCNDRWFEMTGVSKARFEDISWPFGVLEEDVELCSQAWERSVIDNSIGQIEFRLQREWHDTHGRRGQAWAYCTFFAEFCEDGSFNGLMGSLLDISHFKSAENTQKVRAEEALEAKRQQENFIDITSHEMRNPLSAIVQCTDSIITSLDDLSEIMTPIMHSRHSDENDMFKEHIDTGLDAAQTILSCAAHQKRIVDDILTFSKLDSNLLLITHVKTDPVAMVQGVIKMFEVDSSKAEVELTRELSQSFHDLDVQWLMLDPSRVSQILINLLGNAIKFTRSESTRKVNVRMSASLHPPSRDGDKINYVSAESAIYNLGNGNEGDDAESIYLKFEVQDTGRGLTPGEQEKLFMRFSQASPKTHVQYGGSGLGLFISRKLTEMQGGEIGFASEADIGSTFAFYVKAARTTPPAEELKYSRPVSINERGSVAPKDVTVLLVEDNLVNQKVLGKQLERQGCTVFVVGHGGEALDFIKTTELWSNTSTGEEVKATSARVSIDVVLMDIEMPIMGGLECTRKLRELEQEGSIVRHLPIISISANARQEQVYEAILAGVDDTITKPFRTHELMPKLNRLVRLSTNSQ